MEFITVLCCVIYSWFVEQNYLGPSVWLDRNPQSRYSNIMIQSPTIGSNGP